MGKTGNYKIPFDGNSMMEYTTAADGVVKTPETKYGWGWPTEWRENTEFEARLFFTGWGKGRSSARVYVRNVDTREKYSFALGAFYEAVTAFGVKPGGHMEGKFTFRKQGSNYGLYPVVAK